MNLVEQVKQAGTEAANGCPIDMLVYATVISRPHPDVYRKVV